MSNPKITFKFPIRKRFKEFVSAMYEFRFKIQKPEDVEFIVAIDQDDEVINSKPVLDYLKNQFEPWNAQFFVGNHSSKCAAINSFIDKARGEYFFFMADDLKPMEEGFEQIMIQDMERFFPDGDGAIYYNDGIQGEAIATHPLVGRKYFDRFGYFCNPAYQSSFSDTEFTEVAKKFGRLKYIDRLLVRHDHPSLGIRSKDDLNIRDDAQFSTDRETFKKRKEAGFP